MLVGGTDTTSTTTAYTAWEIARNPAIQEHLFEELKVFDLTSPLALTDLERLPFLNGCLKEGLRMHTGLLGPTCRVVPETGATLYDYYLPHWVNFLSYFR
jgi:cytochrome P450